MKLSLGKNKTWTYFLFELHGYPFDNYEGLHKGIMKLLKELFYHAKVFEVI